MDLDFLYTLQNLRTPFSSTVMNLCSYLASELLVVAAMCLLYWVFNKEFAYKLCFSYFVSGLMIQGLKVTFRIPRPWLRDSRLYVDSTAESAATGYSFPSGHTQTATALYGSFALHLKKWWSYLIGVIAIALVMFSRMFLGCHTPQDVLVSLGISLVLVVLVSVIMDHIRVTDLTRTIVFLLILAASLFLTVYTFILIQTGRIADSDLGNAYDAIKCAGAGVGFGFGYYLEKNLLNFDPKQTKKVWAQILKVAIGLVVALAFKELPKQLIHDDSSVQLIVCVHFFRYILTVLWVIYIYPVIFTKVPSRSSANPQK